MGSANKRWRYKVTLSLVGWEQADAITVQCRYNTVQFITILLTALLWQQQNLNMTSNSQQIPHTSPSRASYGVSVMKTFKQTDALWRHRTLCPMKYSALMGLFRFDYNMIFARSQYPLIVPWRCGSNFTSQWRHNESDGDSNHRFLHCLVKRLFRRRSKKTSKLRVAGLCEGNWPVTGEFPAQMASNT